MKVAKDSGAWPTPRRQRPRRSTLNHSVDEPAQKDVDRLRAWHQELFYHAAAAPALDGLAL